MGRSAAQVARDTEGNLRRTAKYAGEPADGGENALPLRIVLDTDIGTDIDDVYALLLAASSPELDLRGVVTVNNDVALRARIARRVLDLIGRADVPVLCGESASLTPGVTRGWMGHEGVGMDLSGPDIGTIEGTGAWLRFLRREAACGEPLTLVTIGPLTDAAAVLAGAPCVHGDDRDGGAPYPWIGRIMSMGSTFEGLGPEAAAPEHNIACDPQAACEVLASPVPVSLVGLNVTRQTSMDRAFVDRLASLGTASARAVTGMHRVWFEAIRSDRSPMHDPLAVAALIRPDIVNWRDVSASIAPSTPEGRAGAVVFGEPTETPSCRVAVSIQAETFHALLEERVLRTLSHTTP